MLVFTPDLRFVSGGVLAAVPGRRARLRGTGLGPRFNYSGKVFQELVILCINLAWFQAREYSFLNFMEYLGSIQI